MNEFKERRIVGSTCKKKERLLILKGRCVKAGGGLDPWGEREKDSSTPEQPCRMGAGLEPG